MSQNYKFALVKCETKSKHSRYCKIVVVFLTRTMILLYVASIIHDIRFCRMLYYKGKVQWIKRNMPLTVFIPWNLSVISTITKNTKISIQTNFFCKGSRAFLTNRIVKLLTMSTWSQNFCVSHLKLYLWFSKEPISIPHFSIWDNQYQG